MLVSVCFRSAFESMALHHSLKTLCFGDTRNRHALTNHKDIHRHNRTHRKRFQQGGGFRFRHFCIETKLSPSVLPSRFRCFHLKRRVSITLRQAGKRHRIRITLNQCDISRPLFRVVNRRHAEFFSQKKFHKYQK